MSNLIPLPFLHGEISSGGLHQLSLPLRRSQHAEHFHSCRYSTKAERTNRPSFVSQLSPNSPRQGRNGVLTARQTSGCWTPLHLCWQGSGPRSDFHNIPSPLIHLFQQVLWGENAPGLFTQIGEGVVNKLKQIGRTFGYSFSLIKTSTELHGIPQRRIRTFYFFWQSPTVPMLQYQKRSTRQDFL